MSTLDRRDIPWLIVLVVLVSVATWPLVPLAFSGAALVGHPVGDLADHFQGAWWFGGALVGGDVPTTTTLTHFPESVPLRFVDPVGALIALVYRPFGMVRAWNLTLLSQVLAGAFFAYWFAASWMGSRAGALVAGTVTGTGSFVLGLLHSGLSEYVGLAPVVLAVWTLLRTMGHHTRSPHGPEQLVEPCRGDRVLAGLAVGACAIQAPYYGVFAALFALCAACGAPVGWKVRLHGLVTVALVAAPFVCVSALWSTGALGGSGPVSVASAPGWQQMSLPTTDLFTFIRPGPYYHPDTPRLGNPGILHVNYLGWSVLGLAVYGFLRGKTPRRLFWPTLALGVLLAGPVLCWGRLPISLGGFEIRLPFSLIYAIPGLELIHHPYRMAAFALPILGLLAGFGARALGGFGVCLAVFGIVLESTTMSPAPWPLATTDTGPDVPVASLPDGAVLDWPPDATIYNRRYQVWQVRHGRPSPYGVNVFLPGLLLADPLVADLFENLDDSRARARNRDSGPMPFPVPNRADHSILKATGFGSVVLHLEALNAGELRSAQQTLRGTLGASVFTNSQVEIWSLAED